MNTQLTCFPNDAIFAGNEVASVSHSCLSVVVVEKWPRCADWAGSSAIFRWPRFASGVPDAPRPIAPRPPAWTGSHRPLPGGIHRTACRPASSSLQSWCLGPDSNRHGVSPKGFSYPYSFRCCMPSQASPACICGLDFTFAIPRPESARGLGRGRQVSTLSLAGEPRRTNTARRGALAAALSSVLQPPSRAAVSPTLTPFTPAVSGPGAQALLKSLASTSFATQARVAEQF